MFEGMKGLTNSSLFWLAYIAMVTEFCRRFDRLTDLWPSVRALPSAGSRMLMSRAMMAITTSSSIRVNPVRRAMGCPPLRCRLCAYQNRSALPRPVQPRTIGSRVQESGAVKVSLRSGVDALEPPKAPPRNADRTLEGVRVETAAGPAAH